VEIAELNGRYVRKAMIENPDCFVGSESHAERGSSSSF
jgi:hypothetical protein